MIVIGQVLELYNIFENYFSFKSKPTKINSLRPQKVKLIKFLSGKYQYGKSLTVSVATNLALKYYEVRKNWIENNLNIYQL